MQVDSLVGHVQNVTFIIYRISLGVENSLEDNKSIRWDPLTSCTPPRRVCLRRAAGPQQVADIEVLHQKAVGDAAQALDLSVCICLLVN